MRTWHSGNSGHVQGGKATQSFAGVRGWWGRGRGWKSLCDTSDCRKCNSLMQLPIEPHLTARVHFKGLDEKNRAGRGRGG